jgi:hypothetical protein
MSVNPTTTNQTPQLLAVLPDWAAGIQQRTVYRTEVTRSRAGLEQRTQHRRRPMLSMEYMAAGIHDAAARRRLEGIVAQSRRPQLVPWWPHGSKLLSAMTTDTSALLASNPIGDDWDRDGWVYLWDRATGQEFRQLASRTGRTLSLTDTGAHLHFPAGAYCFPVRLCLREKGDDLLNPGRHRTNPEKLIFRTL